ncbi:hypothetical protein RDV78_10315 [Bacillota bacterium LX-D]|nr:hypothetical protein [Bacillota bacterium LX-D]
MTKQLVGNCLTTAMGIMPHKSIEQALDLALSLDIPFWPQLPRYSYYEDMYVQASERFPGIVIDLEAKKISFNMDKFMEELPEYIEHSDDESYFELSSQYSAVLDEFLKKDLSGYQLIRGQNIGPLSFGLKIVDETDRPIIYNDEVRPLLFEFFAQRINTQYAQLKAKNSNAFVWIDEPGLEMLFSSMTGYTSETAKKDFIEFSQKIKGPWGVHLCGNPDWSFLLTGIEMNVLSVNIFNWGHIFTRYYSEVKDFLDRGGIISWGIVPTLTEEFSEETVNSIIEKLESHWNHLEQRGIDKQFILSRSWLAPAKCCLVNLDGGATVEESFKLLKEVSSILRARYNLA